MTKWLLFVRWSEIDQHFELVDSFDSEQEATKAADKQFELGALATRIELRHLPEKKGKKDAKKSDDDE